ncbi:hypothetical protein AALB53_21195 [Lachnospiraceae bacterium 47-T17]
MPRKAKTEETVVTEENILHENDMETENVPDTEGTGMDEENPDTLSVDAGTNFSAAEESAETSTPAEPLSTNEESAGEDTGMEETLPEGTAVPDEQVRKETIPDGEDTDPAAETAGPPETPSAKPASKPARKKTKASAAKAETPAAPAPIRKAAPSTILTLNADAETPESREDTIWHELQNAYRTRKILTGTLGDIEKMEGGGTIAVVYYKEMRVVIPLAEMMINLVEDAAHDYGELVQRQNKILGNMLGCEIDFIIKGLDNASRSVVASRKDAMYKKRQIFYMPDANGISRVCEDRIVQARVIAVAEKVVRVEIFRYGMFHPCTRPVMGLDGRRHRALPCGRADPCPHPERQAPFPRRHLREGGCQERKRQHQQGKFKQVQDSGQICRNRHGHP